MKKMILSCLPLMMLSAGQETEGGTGAADTAPDTAPRMRAKFQVDQVKTWENGTGEELAFRAVGADSYGENGENEDNDFARFTPAGHLVMAITNPSLMGKLKEGQKFYLDFTPAD